MERAIHAVSSGAQQRALVLSSYRMNPHYVLLDFPGRRICHLITVLFRPAFRETVVGRKPYFEIVGLRQSSHQKIRRSRFRIMPACAYRSTTARIRPLWPKPRLPLRPRGGSKKKSARNRPEPPDGENLPAPGLLLRFCVLILILITPLPLHLAFPFAFLLSRHGSHDGGTR